MGSTDTCLSCPCAAGTVSRGQRPAPGPLAGFIPCLPHQVLSPLSQPPAAPCTHHPLKEDEQLQAPIKPAEPLAFVSARVPSFQRAHHQEPPGSQFMGEPSLPRTDEVSCFSCILCFCSPFFSSIAARRSH